METQPTNEKPTKSLKSWEAPRKTWDFLQRTTLGNVASTALETDRGTLAKAWGQRSQRSRATLAVTGCRVSTATSDHRKRQKSSRRPPKKMALAGKMGRG